MTIWRQYNRGDGSFEDATDEAGVRDGSWGWGSCFADFDNDGHLDLFHVNGWGLGNWWRGKPARLFMARGDGTFVETANGAGIDDSNEGRGVVCFDYDRDGDIDVFISNNSGPTRLYENIDGNAVPSLRLKLVGRPPNTAGIGARVRLRVGDIERLDEIRAGSNYVSQDPAEAHFGLGSASKADRIEIRWPSGASTVLSDIPGGQRLIVREVRSDANCDGVAAASDLTRVALLLGTSRGLRACPGGDLDHDGQVAAADRDLVIRDLFE